MASLEQKQISQIQGNVFQHPCHQRIYTNTHSYSHTGALSDPHPFNRTLFGSHTPFLYLMYVQQLLKIQKTFLQGQKGKINVSMFVVGSLF